MQQLLDLKIDQQSKRAGNKHVDAVRTRNCSLLHEPGFSEIASHSRFTQYVFSRRQRGTGHFTMQVWPGPNDNSVDRRIGNKFLPVRILLWDLIFHSDTSRGGRRPIDDTNDFDIVNRG